MREITHSAQEKNEGDRDRRSNRHGVFLSSQTASLSGHHMSQSNRRMDVINFMSSKMCINEYQNRGRFPYASQKIRED